MDNVLKKKDVTRLRVDAGCRLFVVTGTAINPDCISINRNPAGYDEHFYRLKQDDVIIREDAQKTFKAVRVLLDKNLQVSFIQVDMSDFYNMPEVRSMMLGQTPMSKNEKNTQIVMNDPMFANIVTHKFTPYGDVMADHLYDAPSFILEHVQDKGFDLRVNEIHFRVDFKDNQFKGSDPSLAMSIQSAKLQLEESDHTLFISRSLRRPFRLTVRSHSAETIQEIEDALIRRFNELGIQLQITNIKRGKLYLALPHCSA